MACHPREPARCWLTSVEIWAAFVLKHEAEGYLPVMSPSAQRRLWPPGSAWRNGVSGKPGNLVVNTEVITKRFWYGFEILPRYQQCWPCCFRKNTDYWWIYTGTSGSHRTPGQVQKLLSNWLWPVRRHSSQISEKSQEEILVRLNPYFSATAQGGSKSRCWC